MNRIHPMSLVAAALTTALITSGCSTQEKIQSLHALTDEQASALSRRAQQQALDAEKERIAQQDVDKPFLTASRAIPLAREVSMPAHLQQRVTVLFDRAGVELPMAIQQLSEATRLPISVTQDALLPAAMFGPRLSTIGSSAPQASAMTGSAPAAAPGFSGTGGRIMLSSMAQGMELYKLLDEVARQAGVSWRAVGAGAEFYRTQTRVFKINVSPHTATTTATLGRNGTNNQVFESQSKTGFVLDKQDPLTGMRNTVEALLTAGGRLTVASESQTFVITDTPQALERVAAYIDEMNKNLARRVRVVVEAIEVTAKDTTQVGFDWNLVYKSIHVGGGTPSVDSKAIGSLVGTNAGTLSTTATTGRFTGSSAMIRALSEVGNIVDRKSFPFVTTSGRPITQALRKTFNYVDSASVTQSSTITTVQQAPTVTQKEETVGTFLTVTPVAKDGGQIFLTLSYDVTTSDPLTTYVVGSASNSVTVQQKSINGTGIVQEIPMRSGQTVVVGGYDSVTGNLTQRRLAPGASMIVGGSDNASLQKSVVVFLVTAVTEEGY